MKLTFSFQFDSMSHLAYIHIVVVSRIIILYIFGVLSITNMATVRDFVFVTNNYMIVGIATSR
jgi:hypothetical protein